jgi:hypothetical protein
VGGACQLQEHERFPGKRASIYAEMNIAHLPFLSKDPFHRRVRPSTNSAVVQREGVSLCDGIVPICVVIKVFQSVYRRPPDYLLNAESNRVLGSFRG